MVFLLGIALLDAQIDQILDSAGLRGASVGIHVVDVANGETVFERNADTLLVPASNQKILTAAFALHSMGAGNTFKTSLWQSNNRIHAHFEGDPTLTTARLSALRQRLGSPTGLPVEAYLSYNEPYGRAWEIDDIGFSYLPVPSAANHDNGVFSVYRRQNGYEILPGHLGIEIVDNQSSAGPSVRFERESSRVVISGRHSPSSSPIARFAIQDPVTALGRLLGGPISVTQSPKQIPENAVQSISQPVREIVRSMLSQSSNFVAEGLLLSASAARTRSTATFEVSRQEMTKFLVDEVGLEQGSFFIADGSGLSRHNLVTARGLNHVLAWSKRTQGQSSVVELLPRSGSGTLGSRLVDLRYRGKTGTLFATSALTGELEKEPGGKFLISVIINHAPVGSRTLKDVEDRIVRAVAKAVEDHQTAYLLQVRNQADAEPCSGLADVHRLPGSVCDGDSALCWTHRRAQPADATPDRGPRTPVCCG